MKKIFNLLLTSILVSTAVYAKTYKIQPNSNSNYSYTQQQNYNYNVYTPSNYTQQSTQNGVSNGGIVEIVMDYSGSMSNAIDAAKQAVMKFYPNIPNGTKVGLRVFGQSGGYNPYKYIGEPGKVQKTSNGKYQILTPQRDCIGKTENGCSNTVEVLPVGLYDGYTFFNAMNQYNTGGSTPLTFGLYLAVTYDLAKFSLDSAKKIILITDGGENCGGDPCAYAKKLASERSDIIIDVILVGDYDSSKFACVANATRGKLYTFDTDELYSGIFDTILSNSINSTPQVPNQETQQTQYTNQSEYGNKYEYIPN